MDCGWELAESADAEAIAVSFVRTSEPRDGV
jgi:hypothetical protein